jgi:hypothetical protein
LGQIWLKYVKLQAMFKVSPASLQTFIDTPNCVQYSTVHIPKWLKLFKIRWRVFCTVIIRCTETFRPLCIFFYFLNTKKEVFMSE